MERDCDGEGVYGLDVRQDREDGVSDKSSRGRSHTRFVDVQALEAKALCNCTETINISRLVQSFDSQRDAPLRSTLSAAVTSAHALGAQYA